MSTQLGSVCGWQKYNGDIRQTKQILFPSNDILIIKDLEQRESLINTKYKAESKLPDENFQLGQKKKDFTKVKLANKV